MSEGEGKVNIIKFTAHNKFLIGVERLFAWKYIGKTVWPDMKGCLNKEKLE